MVLQSAFVFIKPHASLDKVEEVVAKFWADNGFTVTSKGVVPGKKIEQKKLIDNHYYSIAAKATLLKPKDLNIPKDKFKAAFGEEWADVLKAGKAFNALDAMKELEVDADELETIWQAAKKDGKCSKFGGGFYCAPLTKGDKTIYSFNCFFANMRSKFTGEDVKLRWMVVQFDSEKTSWEDFRGKFLGATDPEKAEKGSIRRQIYENWKDYGLPAQPNVGDNSVHGSASPFEALCEMMNWTGLRMEKDSFGAALAEAGIRPESMKVYSKDPQVTYGPKAAQRTGSLFDALEDMDAPQCAALLALIHSYQPAAIQALEKQNADLAKQIDSLKKVQRLVQDVTRKDRVVIPEKTEVVMVKPEVEKQDKGKGGKKGDSRDAGFNSKGASKGQGKGQGKGTKGSPKGGPVKGGKKGGNSQKGGNRKGTGKGGKSWGW